MLPGHINNIMPYIEYLDLPLIPENLIPPLSETLQQLPTAGTAASQHTNSLTPDSFSFLFKVVSPELESWIKSIFPYEITIKFNLIKHTLPIHKDVLRDIGYNYILDPGGPNVSTNIYADDGSLLQSEVIQPHRWIKLEVSYFHGIHDIDPNLVRRLISVTPMSSAHEAQWPPIIWPGRKLVGPPGVEPGTKGL